MNPIILAIACVAMAVVSTKLLKYFSTAVPVILIGLPVILGGLGIVGVVALCQALGFAAAAPAAGLIAGVFSFAGGCKLSSTYFTEAMTPKA